MSEPLLFTPIALRGLALRNRAFLSPMCQYAARDGMANDWHLAHLGRFALGGFGSVCVEAAAVSPEGRISPGDVGLWSDEHIAPLARVAQFIKAHGASPAIQIAHAGRKAGSQRPWHGMGPLGDPEDIARGEPAWPTVSASALPVAANWPTPRAFGTDEIPALVDSWRQAARRAREAGYEIAEIHAAHGYLLNQFLSPVSNRRNDRYGGDIEGRMRAPLMVAEAVRSEWPEHLPVFVRISAVDGAEGGWSLEDSVVFSKALKAIGIDAIDCSSGGIGGAVTAANIQRGPGFQVPYAETIRREAGIPTIAVGHIVDGPQAEAILEAGQADIIAIAREALVDPNWALTAEAALKGADAGFGSWPKEAGWWLDRRRRTFNRGG